MFGISVLPRPKNTNRASTAYRPRIDELEERYCLDGSHLTMNAVVLPGHTVQLSGSVTGGPVEGVTVKFTGAVTGGATTDINGNYSYTTTQASLGTVTAVGLSQLNEYNDTTQATISVDAPTLSLSLTYGAQHTVTLTGILTDIDAASQTITITGVASGSPVTDSSGNFSLTTVASALGTVNATETDLWGLTSNTASVTVANNAPVIQGFQAVNSIGNIWTFSGQVVGDNPEGLTIRFGGLNSLTGTTTTVQADGTFSFTVTLAAGECGTATAITTGWWGADSNQAYYLVG